MKVLALFMLLASTWSLQYYASGNYRPMTDTVQKADTIKITYKKNIKSLMFSKCSPCHFPPDGNGENLDTYDVVKESIDDIVERVKKEPGEDGFMPRKHAKLSDSLIHVFVMWKKQGLFE